MSAQIQIVLPGLFDLPLGELEPDLMFLAIGLPGLTGIAVLKSIQPEILPMVILPMTSQP